MIFFSYTFLSFMMIVYLLYWNISSPSIRKVLLFCACGCFHWYFAGPAGVIPIIFLAIGTYFSALSQRRYFCLTWIVVCVSALVFYKYTHFISLSIIGAIDPDFGVAVNDQVTGILPNMPPLGISFFVFEFVHYLIEVIRKQAPIRSPLQFGIFAIFWPSLVAGPVKRYQQFSGALAKGLHTARAHDIAVGLRRVAIGVFKKFIADGLTVLINEYGGMYDYLPPEQRWLVFVGVGIRILFDFSGYSDMGIGFARMFGIRLPENFNWPYKATNITDFWRRWHISLSSWIRDYIYIPLGGNRYGVFWTSFNAFFAMTLCGFWHGAAWNFMLWGLFHGAGLIVHSAYRRIAVTRVFSARPESISLRGDQLTLPGVSSTASGEGWLRCSPLQIYRWMFYYVYLALSWCSTMIFVLFGWLLFFYPAPKAVHMFSLLFVR